MSEGHHCGYMRIHIGLFENTIAFGQQAEPFHIGESLLQFIYSDLHTLKDRSVHCKELLLTCHPYFQYVDTAWMNEICEYFAGNIQPDLHMASEDLLNLQQTYGSLLSQIYTSSTGFDTHAVEKTLAKNDWFQNENCFCRMNYTVPDTDALPCLDFFVASFKECLFIELTELLKRHIIMKSCKNCGRLFIPRRANMDYCPRIYTADGKTCSEVGYSQTFAKNVKNDELLLAYTRAYKAHYARMTKPRKKSANLTRPEFDAWYQDAKQRLEMARAGLLDAEVFKAWLKE